MKENYDEKNYDPEVERLADLLARVTKRVLLPVAIVIALVVVVLLVGCHKENTSEATLSAKVTVTVNDFTISQEEFPGAKTSPASYSGVKAMTLAFFDANGDQAYCTTQLRADNTTYTTFGQFELSLNLGSYTMIVLGYGSEVPMTVTSATEASYTADRCRETFVAAQAVNVTSTNPLSLSAELSRVVSKLIVNSTDPRISGVDSVRMTFSAGAKGVNPQTGLASSSNGLSNTVAISTAVGNTSSSASYLFLNADQQSMTVTVETLRTNGTVYSTRTVENVPLQRNAITLLTGPLYTNASGASFTLSTSWIGDTNRVSF